jgi:hypothetical protein
LEKVKAVAMPSYSEIAERMKLPISFLYGSSRILFGFNGLMLMTCLYIITISVLSYFMRHRRATDSKLFQLQNELKMLEKDSAANANLKEKYETKKKEYQDLKGSYKPFNINFITIPHNFIMCIYSLYSWIGVLFVMIDNNRNAPLSSLVCDTHQLQKKRHGLLVLYLLSIEIRRIYRYHIPGDKSQRCYAPSKLPVLLAHLSPCGYCGYCVALSAL